MATRCVEQFGAELISVRLEGTHPDKGDKSAERGRHGGQNGADERGRAFDHHRAFPLRKNNEVMRKVAEAAAGENCLINWVEKGQLQRRLRPAVWRTAIVFVAQFGPLILNMAKQLRYSTDRHGVPGRQDVLGPAFQRRGLWSGISYSMMERIRLNGLAGDDMLRMPMMITPGRESALAKESLAPEKGQSQMGTGGSCGGLVGNSDGNGAFCWPAPELLVLYHPKPWKS